MSLVEGLVLPFCSYRNGRCDGDDVSGLGIYFAAIPVTNAGCVIVDGGAFQAVGFWACGFVLKENSIQLAFTGSGEGLVCFLFDPVFADVAIVGQQPFLNADGCVGAGFHGFLEAAYVFGWVGGFGLCCLLFGGRFGHGFSLVIPNDAANDESPEADAYSGGQNDFGLVVHFPPQWCFTSSSVVCNGRGPIRQAGCMGVMCG